MDMPNFEKTFEALTGFSPLRWQRRLYDQFVAGEIPGTIDLPTGMGKTSVMAIWLLARHVLPPGGYQRLPTRLIYVVDRRTVVDQATALAEKLAENSGAAGLVQPNVSTLRGQFADNRDWTRDPSKPAIIIGTVDMIGSRLLFSGYRSSFKQRPLDAGLLGQDSLLVLDEAHLSHPFAKLLEGIGSQGPFQKGKGKPVQVVCMSATLGKGGPGAFSLSNDDLADDGQGNIVRKRFHARKHLHLHDIAKDVKREMAEKAAELAGNNDRVVVFVRSPDDAVKIADEIRKSGSKKSRPFEKAVAVLTGTMRGLERDELLEKPEMKRFLSPANDASAGPALLVSTSAGEVGFDLNADHMVCDIAPIDSMIQRLGRVNRRGEGEAQVHVFAQDEKHGKVKKKEKSPYEAALAAALKVLRNLPREGDVGLDVSPKALASLDIPDAALTPKPATAELTDILLDNWSMTTIVEPMPGRPPVADWLRGIADERPDTTIAWRAELDLEGFGRLDIDDIEEWFDAHRVLPHETLTVPTRKAADFLLARWEEIRRTKDDKHQNTIGNLPCIIDRGGLRVIKLHDLVDRIGRKRLDDLTNAELILPASFGGIERGVGLLDENSPKRAAELGASTDGPAADVADEERSGAWLRRATIDAQTLIDCVADEERSGAWPRRRLTITDGTECPLFGELFVDQVRLSRFSIELPSDDDTVRRLVSLVPKPDRPEFGSGAQVLVDHVGAVERHAKEIAGRLSLDSRSAEALQLAALWHDEGKKRPAWQNAVGGTTAEPLAKSGGRMCPVAGSYRHEFGSLREFTDKCGAGTDAEIFDLAAHLIAAHHGRSRPHFPKGGFDPDARARSPGVASEAIRRFARLQRKYGWWQLAWLESLLRCADAMASAENSVGGGEAS